MLTKNDIYNIIPEEVLRKLINDFKLDINGYHGFYHWARVVDHGVAIADRFSLNKKIPIVFGFFHDIKREGEDYDEEHGSKGASILQEYSEKINVSEQELSLIVKACQIHTVTTSTDEPEIGMCLDSDRLDLGRFIIYPESKYLSILSLENDPDFIEERYSLAKEGYIPDWAADIYSDFIEKELVA